MRPVRGLALLSTAVLIAACGGGSPTNAPATGGTATSGTGATTAATTCSDSTATTVVATGVASSTWAQPVSAKVGDVITWSNDDSIPHRVATDDGSCAMGGNIPGGGSKSLVFSVAGTYPFHCAVHPNMKGTITIT